MESKTGEMPALAAAASELGRRGNQGVLDAIVRTGIVRKDAPTFCGKRTYDGNIDTIVRTGVAHKEASSELSRRAQDSRRFAPSFAQQRIAKIQCNIKMDFATPATNWYPGS
jgi:hypothetical protein